MQCLQESTARAWFLWYSIYWNVKVINRNFRRTSQATCLSWFLYKMNVSLCSCLEYDLLEECRYQLKVFFLVFQAFFLVYALGCLTVYYGEVRDWIDGDTIHLGLFWYEFFAKYYQHCMLLIPKEGIPRRIIGKLFLTSSSISAYNILVWKFCLTWQIQLPKYRQAGSSCRGRLFVAS